MNNCAWVWIPASHRAGRPATVSAIRNRNFLPSGELEQRTVTYADVTGNLTWLIAFLNIALSAGYTQQRRQRPTAGAAASYRTECRLEGSGAALELSEA
jgi:hypothetical protein